MISMILEDHIEKSLFVRSATLMLVTLRWRLFPHVGNIFNVKIQSPTSQIGHLHLKVFTNINCLQHPSSTSL